MRRILLFGGSGLLGSELQPLLRAEGYELLSPSHAEVDCQSEAEVRSVIRAFRPQGVVMAAAQIGGILANIRHGSDYLRENSLMNLAVLRACADEGTGRVLTFGSSCMYPSNLQRPIAPGDLLGGPLEPTSEGYAISKILTTLYSRALRREGRLKGSVCVPASLYGDRDNFSADEGHLISSLIVKIHQAKEDHQTELELWGDGTPLRDFLHVSDAARAVLTVLKAEELPEIIHIGSGRDRTVREIAEQVAGVVGFRGELLFKGAVFNGTLRKLLSVDWLIAQGWAPRVSLEEGLKRTYRAYLSQLSTAPCRP